MKLDPRDYEQRRELMQYCRERDARMPWGIYKVYGNETMGFVDVWSATWKAQKSRLRGTLCWFYTSVWVIGNLGPLADIIKLKNTRRVEARTNKTISLFKEVTQCQS